MPFTFDGSSLGIMLGNLVSPLMVSSGEDLKLLLMVFGALTLPPLLGTVLGTWFSLSLS